MKTAVIFITILGCDDKVSQCEFHASPPERFVSIALCDAASEKILERYGDIGYPTAVAVCQEPAAEPAPDVAVHAQPEASQPSNPVAATGEGTESHKNKTLAARAAERIRHVLPGTSDIKMIFETPIHVVSDSYSWVAKKITQ